MAKRDIIVIGASLGGVETLCKLVSAIPSDIEAAIFIVLHTSPNHPSILPTLLQEAGILPASHAVDGEEFKLGHIYVAPPNHHLLLERDHLHVVIGPKENHSRPAVDPLFRSAAYIYGPRVIGVVLTGNLNDGTSGLWSIKSRDGIAIVQDPEEAISPSMPTSAMQYVKVDYCLPVLDIASLLVQLSKETVKEEGDYNMSDNLELEINIVKQNMDSDELLGTIEKLGKRAIYTCPECNGNMWELQEEEMKRYRCHVGHAFTAETLLSLQSEQLEGAIWSAVRSMEERILLIRQLANYARRQNNELLANNYEKEAKKMEEQQDLLKQFVVKKGEKSLTHTDAR
jgi:two-component system, chemotaxis family, protein-glutamate methylesterase/glutaminase